MFEDGVWRTVAGRRIFIKNGQRLTDAMKNSGKFKKKDIQSKLKKQFKKEQKYDDTKYKYLEEDDYDKYNDMSDESYDKLTAEERRLINDHYVKTEESYYINSVLREKEVNELGERRREQVKVLDKACKTYTAKEDMASTRFVDMNYLRNAYGLEIQRFGDVDRSAIANQMKSYIGSEISSKAFTSISLNEEGNGMFNNLAVKQKINMPKGTKMYVADNPGEYEAILGRNQKMVLKDVSFKESKVAGFEKEYGKILLTYEVINDD